MSKITFDCVSIEQRNEVNATRTMAEKKNKNQNENLSFVKDNNINF